jgi:hypothetical protein
MSAAGLLLKVRDHPYDWATRRRTDRPVRRKPWGRTGPEAKPQGSGGPVPVDYTQEQLQAEERPLMLLLAQLENTISELDPGSPWVPCLSRAAAGLRVGLGL